MHCRMEMAFVAATAAFFVVWTMTMMPVDFATCAAAAEDALTEEESWQTRCSQSSQDGAVAAFNRNCFPSDFIFGTSSSSYQYEGAAFEDGRMPSVWDVFCHTPGHILSGDNGDVAVDQYHQYKEDVKLMAAMGVDAYRFSISWSRLIPKAKGEVNAKGVEYYNNLINELLKYGIKPFVTLHHFDLPQSLEDEYGGWISSNIVDDFAKYAQVCFGLFGDRVKHWITLNEPDLFSLVGYDLGVFPPSRCSAVVRNCSSGDSAREPYIATHNQIIAHLRAVEIYNSRYKTQQNGSVGIVLAGQWYEPLTNSSADLAATDRMLDFTVGWILDPLLFGRYPESMTKIVGSRLPNFTAEESERLRNTGLDFIGLNHYTTNYVYGVLLNPVPRSYLDDIAAERTGYKNGIPIGPQAPLQTDVEKDFCVPRGIKGIVSYISRRYNYPDIYITENGLSENTSLAEHDPTQDTYRVGYHREYLRQLSEAVREGAKVKGYFAWTLMDAFEFRYGYTFRYGLMYVDRSTESLHRVPKASGKWYRSFLKPVEIEPYLDTSSPYQIE